MNFWIYIEELLQLFPANDYPYDSYQLNINERIKDCVKN